jgi:hypothetical protein
LPALVAIMAEWAQTTVSNATRVKHLLGALTGGKNGAYRLNATTVSHDGDGAANTLWGGPNLEWFFAKNLVDAFGGGEAVTWLS